MATFEQLKYLSERRLEAAEILSNNDIYDIAYHDSGYVIELGLKAVICKTISQTVYPDNQSKYRTHHFNTLVSLAGLDKELADKKATDRQFMKNWSIATKWSVGLRYQPGGKDVANITTSYLKAISSDKNGVLPWLKTHW